MILIAHVPFVVLPYLFADLVNSKMIEELKYRGRGAMKVEVCIVLI